MVENILLTGDCHGDFTHFGSISSHYEPSKTIIIILGDAGINYWLDDLDNLKKDYLTKFGYTYYCVQGNHEEAPQNVPGLITEWDDDVNGYVYVDFEYPNIRYFINGAEYKINDKTFLVLGGAYSVDKEFRLMRGWHWFKDEQISPEEMSEIFENIKDNTYDYVLSHTCPYSWRPIDKFLPSIDQSKVDSRTEKWLEKINNNIEFDTWFCGHYHIFRTIEQYRSKGIFLFNEFYDLNKDDVLYKEWSF